VGRPEEFAALVRAFVEVGPEAIPDFITVDGAEGGTGAAPPEFSNRVGMPLHEGLTVVKGILRGAGLRNDNGGQVKIISSGRVVNGFDLVKLLALGADVCNSARAMMFALGCIQALACNTNRCPTGENHPVNRLHIILCRLHIITVAASLVDVEHFSFSNTFLFF